MCTLNLAVLIRNSVPEQAAQMSRLARDAVSHCADCSACAGAMMPPCELYMTRAAFAQLERFLAGLDRQHSYYSVSNVAGLIREEKLDIPCDLKLTLFVGEGDQDVDQAPHMNVVPIPLLGLVRVLGVTLRQALHMSDACVRSCWTGIRRRTWRSCSSRCWAWCAPSITTRRWRGHTSVDTHTC